MKQVHTRNPLLVLPLIAGTLLMALIAFFLVLAGAVMLGFAAITRRFSIGSAPSNTGRSRVLDAQYEVVEAKTATLLVGQSDPR